VFMSVGCSGVAHVYYIPRSSDGDAIDMLALNGAKMQQNDDGWIRIDNDVATRRAIWQSIKKTSNNIECALIDLATKTSTNSKHTELEVQTQAAQLVRYELTMSVLKEL